MFVFLPRKVVERFFARIVACIVRGREARYAECAARPSQSRSVRPSLEGLEDRTLLSSYRFLDTGSGNWTTAGDWQVLGAGGIWQTATQAPGAGDTVDIQSGSGSGMILNSTAAQTVGSLSVEGKLVVDGKLTVNTMTTAAGSTLNLASGDQLDVHGSASFGGGGTISGHIDDLGGTVTFNPSSSMTLASGASLTGSLYNIYGSVNVTGALSQQATIVLDNNASSPAGVQDGTVSPTAGALVGTGNISDGGDFYWYGGAISLSGGVTFLANANLQLQGANSKDLETTLTNKCNTSTLGGTGALLIGATAGTFDNLGNPKCIVTIPSIVTGRYGKFINDTNGFFEEQGTTTIQGNFTNLGMLKVGGGSTLTISTLGTGGGVEGTATLNGTLQLDGVLTLLGGGNGNLKSTTGFTELGGSGTLKIGDGVNKGTLTMQSGSSAVLSNPLEVTSTGTLTGGGQIQNNAKLILDIGSLTYIGSYLASNSGILDLKASSANLYSSLIVAGSAQLSGTLELDFLNGYVPASGTTFVVLKAPSIGAHFDSTPPGMNTTYTPNAVIVTQGRIVEYVYPNGNVLYRVYSADGSSRATLTDSNGNLLADYSYNAQGQLTAYDVYYANGNVFYRVYAPDGSSTATLRDKNGNLLDDYSYNAQGVRTAYDVYYSNGNVFHLVYTADGSSTATLKDGSGNLLDDYSYNAQGQFTAYDVYYSNGNVFHRVYAADGSSTATFTNNSGVLLDDYTYNAQGILTAYDTYSANGNVFHRTYSSDGSSTATLKDSNGNLLDDYTYNAQGVLTAYDLYYSNGNFFHRVYAADGSSTATLKDKNGNLIETYTYDAQGNLISHSP